MHGNRLKFEFDAQIEKAYKDDDGTIHIVAIVSDDGIDLAQERISLEAQKQMAQQVTQNRLPLLDNHRATFGFGFTTEGTVRKSSDNGKSELVVDFQLDPAWPHAIALFKGVDDGTNDKQLSIGGFVDREKDTIEADEKGQMIRVINSIELEHIAMTRKDMACNPRTRTLAAVIKSLYEKADDPLADRSDFAVATLSVESVEKERDDEEVKKAAVAFKSYPIVPLEEETRGWTFTPDESNAVLWRGAGVRDGESFARAADDLQGHGWHLFRDAHAWWDSTKGNLPPDKSAYKLAHHKLDRNNHLVTFFQGTAHAMSRSLPGGFNSGLIPHMERESVIVHLAQHYAEFGIEPPPRAQQFLREYDATNQTERAAALGQWLIGVTFEQHQEWLAELGHGALAEEIYKTLDQDIEEHQTDYDLALEKGIVAFKAYPLADRDNQPEAWSFTVEDKIALLYAGAHVVSRRDWANAPEKTRTRGWRLYREAHAWIDDAYEGFPYPQNKSAYLLPHHKLVDGTLKTFFTGVAKSMASMMPGGWARRRIRSTHARARVWRHLAGHLREFGIEPPQLKELEVMTLGEFIEWFKDPEVTSDLNDVDIVLLECKRIAELLSSEEVRKQLATEPPVEKDGMFDLNELSRPELDEATIVPEVEPQVPRLVARSGDEQVGRPGQLLAEPLVVWARTAEGQPAQGVTVEFTIDGPGALSVESMDTDSAGRAWVLVTLADEVGDVIVMATADAFGPPVSFQLQASNDNEESNMADLSTITDEGNDAQATLDVDDNTQSQKAAVAFKSYPKAEKDMSWSFSAEDGNRLLGDGGTDWASFKAVHAWFNETEGQVPTSKDAYRLPHHKIVDGRTITIFRGVVAAGAALVGARGGVAIPSDDRPGVARHIARHYREFDEEPPDRLQALTQREIDPETATKEVIEEALVDALAEFLSTTDLDGYLKWLNDNGHKTYVKAIVDAEDAARRKELGLDEEVEETETPEEVEEEKVADEAELVAPVSDPLADAIGILAALFGKEQTGSDNPLAGLTASAMDEVRPELLALAGIIERTKKLDRESLTEKDLDLARRLHNAFFHILASFGADVTPPDINEDVMKSLQEPLQLVLKEALKVHAAGLGQQLEKNLEGLREGAEKAIQKGLDEMKDRFENALKNLDGRLETVEQVGGVSQRLTTTGDPVEKSQSGSDSDNPFRGMFNGAIVDMLGGPRRPASQE